MAVNKNTISGTGYQVLLAQSGLSGKTVSNVELTKTGNLLSLTITPSAGNPAIFLFKGGEVKINSSGSGLDEWTSAGSVNVTPQHG